MIGAQDDTCGICMGRLHAARTGAASRHGTNARSTNRQLGIAHDDGRTAAHAAKCDAEAVGIGVSCAATADDKARHVTHQLRSIGLHRTRNDSGHRP